MRAKHNIAAFTIGWVAGRLGISVRAVRLYEAEGLLNPGRTEAGRRIFSADDLARLRQVLVLKTAGCTLAQIRAVLAGNAADFAALIDLRIAALNRQHHTIAHTLARLRAAQCRLTHGQTPSLADFCTLIEQGDNDMADTEWKQVFQQYYTPEEMERWRAAKSAFSDTEIAQTQAAWSALIARVEAAMAEGATPACEAAMRLACEWHDLQKPLVEALGIETWNKGARMNEEMASWQTDKVRAPFSAEVFRFIAAAAEAARAQGLIPPRAKAA
jgi:DNA-binding transcriptional MerR regulator